MTDPAPHEAIAEIELRLKAVTPGMWRTDNHANMVFLRHAPADIATLLTALASRDAEIARLTGELAGMKERCAKVCDEDYAHRLRQAQLALDDHTPIFSKKQLLESKAMVSFGLAAAIRALPDTEGDG